MAESTIWHREQKTQLITEYYIALVDGEKTVSFILKHDASKNEVIAEPYKPVEFDYTVHDGCEHDADYCVLDDPESSEYEEAGLAQSHSYAVRNLQALEAQIRQQRIAERLNSKVEAREDDEAEKAVLDQVETEKAILALLKELPAHYPEPKFTKEERGYVLEIDRTLIFNGVPEEEALKDTRHYVEARKKSPTLPIGVIYGIYD